MAITAAEVNKLRLQTGAGMMDCKNALVESNGDFETAIDILRKKGQKIAAKRGDNEAKEGLIFSQASEDGKTGVILTLNCETDFVAMNDNFREFMQSLVDIALKNMPNSIEELVALPYNDKLSVAEKITEHVGVVGEKLDLSGYAKISAEQVAAYNHPGNQIATLVGMNKQTAETADAGKQVAMQIAAMNPVAVDKDGVDPATIEREIEIAKDVIRQEGKPEEMVEKIAAGKLNKFYKDSTLLNQEFVKDGSMDVRKFLDNTSKGLTVTAFTRVQLGA